MRNFPKCVVLTHFENEFKVRWNIFTFTQYFPLYFFKKPIVIFSGIGTDRGEIYTILLIGRNIH